jgi:hypothetical protein
LSRKDYPNHDASLTSKALITSAHVGGYDANPINTIISSALVLALSSLATSSDEPYESICDDKITLLVRTFCALYKFHNERGRSPRGCFESGDTTIFIADCSKRKKLDSFNKYNYNNNKWNNSSNKGDDNKKKKLQKIMSRAYAS